LKVTSVVVFALQLKVAPLPVVVTGWTFVTAWLPFAVA